MADNNVNVCNDTKGLELGFTFLLKYILDYVESFGAPEFEAKS